MYAFKLKDINVHLLKACLSTSYQIFKDYVKYLLLLRFISLSYAVATDIKLLFNLPYIIASRNAEMDMAKKAQADRHIQNALGRPARGIEKPCDDAQ